MLQEVLSSLTMGGMGEAALSSMCGFSKDRCYEV